MTAAPSLDAPTDPGAGVLLRVVATHRPGEVGPEETTRLDVSVRGEDAVLVRDGRATRFPATRLWPTLRDALPDVGPLRAPPTGRLVTEQREPPSDLAERARALVVVATLVDHGSASPADDDATADPGEVVAVRTWFATHDELWSAAPSRDGGTRVRPAPPGAVADLLVWDVAAGSDVLVARRTDQGRQGQQP